MAKYYVFTNETTFHTESSKKMALHSNNPELKKVVFRHLDGIPNPWFCNLINSDGTALKDKNGVNKIFTHKTLTSYLKKFFHVKKTIKIQNEKLILKFYKKSIESFHA